MSLPVFGEGAVDFNEFDKRYVRRNDPEYQRLLMDVRTMKTDVNEAKKSSWRTERYLVGGLDDDGKYTFGMATWIKILTGAVGAFLVVWPLLVHYKVIP